MQSESSSPDAPKDDNSTIDPTSEAEWNYNPEQETPAQSEAYEMEPLGADTPTTHHDTVTWTASEYVAHDKSPLWYGVLGLLAVALSVITYIFTQDFIAPVVITIMAVLFGVSAARKPQTLTYEIDDKGIAVGAKHYSFAMFKSFGVTDDTSAVSITLLSVKRFMPPLSIYYPPEQEDKIIEKLADYLPFEHHKADLIEQLMLRIRF